jgi:hypothetical protein
LLGVFKTGLQVNAVGPHVDVALGRQIALPPMLGLVEPDLLEPRDGRGRQARRILAEQRRKRLLKSRVNPVRRADLDVACSACENTRNRDLAKARAQGTRSGNDIGRPKVAADKIAAVRAALAAGNGIRKVARAVGVRNGTVQQIAREMRTA